MQLKIPLGCFPNSQKQGPQRRNHTGQGSKGSPELPSMGEMELKPSRSDNKTVDQATRFDAMLISSAERRSRKNTCISGKHASTKKGVKRKSDHYTVVLTLHLTKNHRQTKSRTVGGNLRDSYCLPILVAGEHQNRDKLFSCEQKFCAMSKVTRHKIYLTDHPSYLLIG